MSADAKPVCLGTIVGAKGLKGEVRVKTFTEVPEDISAYGPLRTADGRTVTVTVVNAAQGVATVRIAGVSDRTAAEALKGLELYVDRAALPQTDDGTYYHADLIGLAVAFANGDRIGKVVAFHNFGGGDVMEVAATEAPGAKTALLPFTADVIAKVDLGGARVVINPMPGLFEEFETKGSEAKGNEETADGHAA